MAESTTTEIFTAILPDANQALSPQIPLIPPLKKRFTCFADLTPEIRLDIYNLLFPPYRSVNIAPQKGRRRQKCPCGPERCTHHPITLFINHESRVETLRHYRLFVRDRMKGGRRVGGQMIYYRPRKDMLHVEWKKINTARETNQHDWIATLEKYNEPRFLEGVRSFEIKYWEFEVTEALVKHQVRLLPLLRTLQTLKLVWNSWAIYDAEAFRKKGEKEWGLSVASVKEYFEELRMRDGEDEDEVKEDLRTVPQVQLEAEVRGAGIRSRWY